MDFDLADPRRTTFREALERTGGQQRHLLLGNGFSIAASTRFNYPSLMAAAFGSNDCLEPLFTRLGARDFEHAMVMAGDADAVEILRREFIAAVLRVHPVRSVILPRWRMSYCAEFLANFVKREDKRFNGRIFTTNYDLLLCWIASQHRELSLYDGFNGMMWNEGSSRRSRLHYLHGALHLYDDPTQRPWERARKQGAREDKQLRLIEVVRNSVSDGRFPLIVSEGSSEDKLKKILGDDYLSTSLRWLSHACENGQAALFVHGHRLGDVDKHIRREIVCGNVRDVYIGVFDTSDEVMAFDLGERWRRFRKETRRPEIRVTVYRSKAVPLWGPPSIFE